jgi:hypothetical protein
MQLLYSINIALALMMLLWPVWFSQAILKLPRLNPFTIILMLDLPIQFMRLLVGPMLLIDEGLFDTGYQLAIAMGTLLIASQLAGLLFFLRVFKTIRIEYRLPFSEVKLSSRDLAKTSKFFVFIYGVSMYMLASSDFGVVNWLMNPREGYQLHRQGLGHWYGLAISSLSVAMVLSFLAKPNSKSVLFSAPFFISFAYLFGSKTILLLIFSSLMIFLWFLQWKHLRKLFVLGAPLIFSLMIWNLYLALADTFELESVFSYFDYYKNAADYYRGFLKGEIELYHGEIMLSSFWSYVPRVLAPDKPFIYGILHINELFFPGQAELTNTPAFGGAVEQFSDFGIPGVMFAGFFSPQSFATAFLSYILFIKPKIQLTQISLLTALVTIMQYAPAFGTFFPAALYMVLVIIVGLVILAFRRSRRVRRHQRSAQTASLQR